MKTLLWMPTLTVDPVNAAGGYGLRELEILARNPEDVAVKGILAGSSVALAEPERKGGKP